jgi:hypothetical protein
MSHVPSRARLDGDFETIPRGNQIDASNELCEVAERRPII